MFLRRPKRSISHKRNEMTTETAVRCPLSAVCFVKGPSYPPNHEPPGHRKLATRGTKEVLQRWFGKIGPEVTPCRLSKQAWKFPSHS